MSVFSELVDGQNIYFSIFDPQAVSDADQVLAGNTLQVINTDTQLSNYSPSNGVDGQVISGAQAVAQFSYFVSTYDADGSDDGPLIIGSGPSSETSTTLPYETYGVMAGFGGTYEAGASNVSIIVAGDYTGSTIDNDNVNGDLVALTGAGGNALVGGGAFNSFTTGIGGIDDVLFDPGIAKAQTNNLVSYGDDTVTINPSIYGGFQTNQIVAAGYGVDLVYLGGGETLTFINSSSQISGIVAGDGSSVAIGGTGDTIISSYAGSESFHFVAPTTTSNIDFITAFTSQDTVVLTGYGNYTLQVDNGSTVLTGDNGSRIVFYQNADSATIAKHIVSA